MSNDLKEQAKKIIAKGKLLNDTELIRMGLEMLDSYDDNPVAVQTAPVKTNNSNAGKFDMQQFTMLKTNSNVIDKSGKKQPIYIGNRENKYADDGVEHKDIKTPFVEPTQRIRKPSIVSATCSVCGKTEKINEIFVTGREFYRCESCLLKGKS